MVAWLKAPAVLGASDLRVEHDEGVRVTRRPGGLEPAPPSEFLKRLPPVQVNPFFFLAVAAYTNTAGTRRRLIDLTAPKAMALVVTNIRPIYFVGIGQQLEEVDNPYLMLLANSVVPHRFDVVVDGTTVGEIGLRYGFVGDASQSGFGGINVAKPIVDLLGWRPGFYAARTKGGGRFSVLSETMTAINVGVGATIPDAVGVEVGGFKVAEDYLRKASRGER